MPNSKSNTYYISLLLALWAVMLLVVNPLGNFPLNDDWMYAHTVQSVLNGSYHIKDYYSPILITQVYWGALFCLPFGFSFVALRVSVIVLAIAGSVLLYLLLAKFNSNKRMAFFCTLLVVANPIWFCLANSFMSDVPFMVFSLICIYYCLNAIEQPSAKRILSAMVAVLPALLARQFGLILPVALAITGLLNKNQKAMRWLYILPVVVIVAILIVAMQFNKARGWIPYEGSSLTNYLTSPALLKQVLIRLCIAVSYLGLFLLPLLIIMGNPLKGKDKKERKTMLIIAALATVPLIVGLRWMPFGNIFNMPNLGPITLKGEMEGIPPQYMPYVYALRVVAFAAAILFLLHFWGAFTNLWRAFKTGNMDTHNRKRMFALICILVYGLLTCVPDFFFDRYILYLLPFMFIFFLPEKEMQLQPSKPALWLARGIVVVFAIYAVVGTQDYMAWNNQSWKAGDYLTKEQNISIHKIDGGYEYNGWYNDVWKPSPEGKSWWFVNDDEYIVSTLPQPGYELIKTFSYTSYLHLGQRSIGIWKRKNISGKG